MRAGAGKAEVDLSGVLPFDGFGSLHDALSARAIMLEAGGRCVCIVSLEMTSIAPALMQKLRAAVSDASDLAGEDVWICVSHTFSAPHVRTPAHLADDAERSRNVLLEDAYVAAVKAAVLKAKSGLQEATFSFGCGKAPVNVNRDIETPAGWWLGANPEGFSDQSVRVLAAEDTQGRRLAVLFSCDVQPSVLQGSRTSDGMHAIAGDLAGVASRAIERELGGEAVALFVVGCAGDQAPVEQAVTKEFRPGGSVGEHDLGDEGFAVAECLGRQLACGAVAGLAVAEPVAAAKIEAFRCVLSCPGQERAEFSTLAPKLSYEYRKAAPVATTVSLISFGRLVLVGLEPEVESAFGAGIRQQARELGLVADVWTLVNGGQKYLPSKSAYQRITYEAMNSAFAEGSEELLRQDILESLKCLS